jgi:GT2 family glycosyltransferase
MSLSEHDHATWGGVPYAAPPPRGPVTPGPMPGFSILIAAYNSAGTIGDAVESALAQRLPAQEVIVVDDGSRDDLIGALAPYRHRIIFRRQENRGYGSAINAAAATATGEFVAILDADDTYHPRRLEALGRLAAARPDLDIVTTDLHFVVDGRLMGRFYQRNHFETVDQRAAILRTCFVGGCPAVRRNRLLEVGGFDESLRTGQDWDCWIRLILDGAMAGLVDEPLLYYRLHEGSLTASRETSLRDRVTVLAKAATDGNLRRSERTVLAASLRHHRRRAALAEAEAAAAPGQTGARRRLLRVALRAGLSPTTRAKMLLACVAPRYVRAVAPGSTARRLPG